jgi:cobalt-zinc-cadmium efflux system outer membrane protein
MVVLTFHNRLNRIRYPSDVLKFLKNLLSWRICAGAVLIACAAASQAEMVAAVDGQLTITEEQAIALFYQRNLGLIAASLNIDNARAREIIAAAIPNPVFSFTVHELAPKAFAR